MVEVLLCNAQIVEETCDRDYGVRGFLIDGATTDRSPGLVPIRCYAKFLFIRRVDGAIGSRLGRDSPGVEFGWGRFPFREAAPTV
jgi:hypothetical protein